MRFLRWLTWTGWRLRHGSRFWLYVSVGAAVMHAVGRLLREPEARASVDLKRGDAVEVRVVDADRR